MAFSTILICFLWFLKESRELSSKVTVLLCISVQGNVYTHNSIYHTIAIASAVSFETIIIYPKILNMHSISRDVNKCWTDFSNLGYIWMVLTQLHYFKLVCFKTSNAYFVSSKYVTKSQIANHKINLKTFYSEIWKQPILI